MYKNYCSIHPIHLIYFPPWSSKLIFPSSTYPISLWKLSLIFHYSRCLFLFINTKQNVHVTSDYFTSDLYFDYLMAEPLPICHSFQHCCARWRGWHLYSLHLTIVTIGVNLFHTYSISFTIPPWCCAQNWKMYSIWSLITKVWLLYSVNNLKYSLYWDHFLKFSGHQRCITSPGKQY